MSIVVFWGLGLLLLALTLLPMWRCEHWSIRGLDFPRLQLLAVSLCYLGAAGSWLGWGQTAFAGPLALGLVCCAVQAWWITPYTPLFPKEVATASADWPCISLLTSNVLMTNRNSAALIEKVQALRPDILVTLETDQWWQQQLACLHSHYPHRISCPLDNLYGMHVYSRLPLTAPAIHFRVEPGVPSMQAQLSVSGRRLDVYFLHPAPPSPTENATSDERDAELIQVAKEVAHSPHPVIVTGDLNDVAWSATTRLFRKISGLLDPRVGRGMFNTFHAGLPFVRWPLDHIFHSHHFGLVSIQRLESIGSDHFPIYTQLALAPGQNSEDDGLQPDAEDRRWAREKVR